MKREQDKDGFYHLWPTVLLRREIPQAELANKVLAEEIQKLEAARDNLTTDYLAENLLARDHPAIGWLRDCVNKTVIDYIRHLGLGYQVDWTLQGWANVNRFGDYHDPHNHPHSWLSGTYYVAVPEKDEAPKGRGDRRPGAISFYDPRAQANMTAIRQDPQIEAEFTVKPKPGSILLWPAFLHHFVHPNLSRSDRISISFNVVLKWSDKYLPRQD